MKKTFLFCCLITILSSSLWGQSKSDDLIKVNALKFEKTRALQLAKYSENLPFKIDINGVMHAEKGHQIIYAKRTKKVGIMPVSKTPTTLEFSSRYEEIELPSGDLIICFCSEGHDNCKFDNSEKENFFVCSGNGCCGIGIIFAPMVPPLRYETSEGDWYGF